MNNNCQSGEPSGISFNQHILLLWKHQGEMEEKQSLGGWYAGNHSSYESLIVIVLTYDLVNI